MMTNPQALDLASRNDVPLRETLHGDELLPVIDGAGLVAVPIAAIVAAAAPETLPPPAWNDIAGKPDAFLPIAHQHAIADVHGLHDALAEKADAPTVAAIAGGLSDLTDDVFVLVEDVSDLELALADKAPASSPMLTGTPTAPTAEAGTSTAQIATTAFVAASIAAIPSDGVAWFAIADKPAEFPPSEHVHTLEDVTDLVTALGDKAPLASPAFIGAPTAPTASAGTNTTQIATTAFARAVAARNTTVIATSGNFTVPAGIARLHVHLWGAGGGGGGTGAANSMAGGGAGGAYCFGILDVTPGQIITAMVGAAGYAGPGGGYGGSGGSTTFAALTAGGGSGGPPNPAGTYVSAQRGAASGGILNLYGGYGGLGQGDGYIGHGGGGGSAPFGGAGAPPGTFDGTAGVAPGGGGAGAGGVGSSGGTGASGLIIIHY